MKNSICFTLWGRYALFTDPITRVGGEKCSYHIPTYEALKGVLKSIYWKPTLVWYVDRLRVLKPIRTRSKGMKPLKYAGGNDLSIYTFLHDVAYQVEAHFEWNLQQPDLAPDRIDGKHYAIVQRMLDKGGRQDIFLGTRDCQGYVEPGEFGSAAGHYDSIDELSFGLMFHSFDYPDETGTNELQGNFWQPVMRHGVIEFPRPQDCNIRHFIRKMEPKRFGLNDNVKPVDIEEQPL